MKSFYMQVPTSTFDIPYSLTATIYLDWGTLMMSRVIDQVSMIGI
jgi:hypothetical protein